MSVCENVRKWKVTELKRWLADHGQKVSGVKEELIKRVEGCLHDHIESNDEKDLREQEERKLSLVEKLRTPPEQLPNPKSLSHWSKNLESIPDIAFKDLQNYLVLGACRHYSE